MKSVSVALLLLAMPAPYATPSRANPAEVVPRPPGAGLAVPAGWRASLFAEGLEHPRNLVVLADSDGDGRADRRTTFAEGFSEPFGLAVQEGTVWVADTRAVWGRPVGIAAAADGSLYVADDAGGTVWKITPTTR